MPRGGNGGRPREDRVLRLLSSSVLDMFSKLILRFRVDEWGEKPNNDNISMWHHLFKVDIMGALNVFCRLIRADAP